MPSEVMEIIDDILIWFLWFTEHRFKIFSILQILKICKKGVGALQTGP